MECPKNIEELREIEQMLPLCRKELYEQAKARIGAGTADSLHDVSRQLGEEYGKKPESIERSLRREQQSRGGTLSPVPDIRKSNTYFRSQFTGENEWYTPSEYIEAARDVMGGISLDPATTEHVQNRIRATTFYTVKDNGLECDWSGNVFLNPPYSQPLISQFIEKAIFEWCAGNLKEMIILTHNYTDTLWFHKAESVASLLCFTRGRIKFERHDGKIGSPTQGQCFFYYGDNKSKFKRIFKTYGFIR